ncbi:MAG: ATP-dependent nuclease [Acidithiobacillus ferrivorans]
MSSTVPEREVPRDGVDLLCPRAWFETITFSDGTELALDQNDIVVLVGPNNAGKSAALRELEKWVETSSPGLVIKGAIIHKEGTRADFETYLNANALQHYDGAYHYYSGIGYKINNFHVQYYDDPKQFGQITRFFVKRLDTETRIQDSNPAPSIALYRAPPTHPIHELLMDEDLSKDVCDKFRQAFGKDLTPFRAGGSNFPLYVGQKPAVPHGKDELSKEFVVGLQNSNVALQEQGDGMRSFASVMLHVLTARTHSIQFIDEPEAFLHPPQARLLGRYIAENTAKISQLFISTHSTDILDGLLEGGADKVRIVRLRRDGDVNRVKELSKEQTATVAKDTLSRFSGVFDGIFYEHVIICESDADCMFYQSILNLSLISGSRRPDVLFVHSAGKHRMAKLAETLRSLDVPVSVIADIDIINDQGTFRQLFEQLGGNWTDLEQSWKHISHAVLCQKPPLNAGQVVGLITTQLDGITGTGEFPEDKERAIKEIFKTKSPWSAMKLSGRSGLPVGEAISHFDGLSELCSVQGLWIVPVGEIEGFCRSIGGHGPRFVEKVLEERVLETDHELQDARDFIRKIWLKIKPPSEGASNGAN